VSINKKARVDGGRAESALKLGHKNLTEEDINDDESFKFEH